MLGWDILRMPGEIFISYRRSDQAKARLLHGLLKERGVDAWYDALLSAGEDWRAATAQALEAAPIFVLMFSQNASVSDDIAKELAAATLNKKVVIPVRLENIKLEGAFLYELASRNWFDAFEDTEANLAQFADRLAAMVKAGVSDEAARATGIGVSMRTAGTTIDSASKRLSICVLPFANMSGEAEQEYFSDGISEDIITDLSKVSALWVAARNTAFTFKGKHVDVPAVARQLKVGYVLEGSVRKSGNRVRITVQLIDASGGHVWAERYDRNLDDIFAVQDEISETIVKVLKVKLLPQEKKAIEQRGTTNPQAYKYYLLARQFAATENQSDRTLTAIVRLCRRSVELDPGYALAWAYIARAQEQLRFLQNRSDQDGTEAMQRALALDDTLAIAYSVNATICGRSGRLDEAERWITRALELEPNNYDVVVTRASLFMLQGRTQQARACYVHALELSTTSCAPPCMLASVSRALGDEAGAQAAARIGVERAERIVAQEPDNCAVIAWLAGALAILGELHRAREWMDRAVILDPDNYVMCYNFACMLIGDIGDIEDGLTVLEPVLKATNVDLFNWIKTDVDLDAVRGHLRFEAMMAAAEARFAADAAG
jgi:adenylate cyclase